MIQSRFRPLLLATTTRDSFPPTMDQQTHRESHAPPRSHATTPSQTIRLQDRQPPSVPNAAADIHPSFLNRETQVQPCQDATDPRPRSDRSTAASSKPTAPAHARYARRSQQTLDSSSHRERKTFLSL